MEPLPALKTPAPEMSTTSQNSEATSATVDFSLIVPVYNEEAMLPSLRARLPDCLDATGLMWEMVFVNDGSQDKTLELLLAWQASEPRLGIIDFSRNFGHQPAVLAGLTHCHGEIVAIIDGDLQDPPECLPEMLHSLDAGCDVVYGIRTARKENAILRSLYWMAYRIINTLSEHPIPLDSGDFCMMRRKVVDAMLDPDEHQLFLRGLRSWVGFKQKPFVYERDARKHGSSKYRFKDLWSLMRNGIYGFTSAPLKIMRWVGTIAISLSILYLAFLSASIISGSTAPRGFSTLIVAISFFGGAQLLATGIVGEYVARIYEEVRSRPRYVVNRIYPNSDRQLPAYHSRSPI